MSSEYHDILTLVVLPQYTRVTVQADIQTDRRHHDNS